MRFKIEMDREDDGRWIAEIPDLPGVMVYGSTSAEAVQLVKNLALSVLAERRDHNEPAPSYDQVSFVTP